MAGRAEPEHRESVRCFTNKENSSSMFVHNSPKHLHLKDLSYMASLPDVSCSFTIRDGKREQSAPGSEQPLEPACLGEPELRAWHSLAASSAPLPVLQPPPRGISLCLDSSRNPEMFLVRHWWGVQPSAPHTGTGEQLKAWAGGTPVTPGLSEPAG